MKIKCIVQVAISLANYSRWHSCNNSKSRYIFCYHCASRNNRTFTDFDIGEDSCPGGYVGPIMYPDWTSFSPERIALGIVADGEYLNVSTDIDIVTNSQPESAVKETVISDYGVTPELNPLRSEEGQSPMDGGFLANT